MKEEWKKTSVKKAITSGLKESGLSSYSAAVTIYQKYKAGLLRNPLLNPPFRYPPVLNKHYKYLRENLRRWKALNLVERTAIINKKFVCILHESPRAFCRFCKDAVRINPSTLFNWYKANNFIWRITPYSIANNYSFEEKLKLQTEFVYQLKTFIDKGGEILFLDEASCDPWETSTRTWMHRDDIIKIDLVKDMKENTPRERVQLQAVISSK